MIQYVDIRVNEQSFELSRSKITSEICFIIEDQFFPEKNWNDFVVVILTWWLHSLKKLMLSVDRSPCDFSFMDGPLLVRGKKIDNDIINLEFVREKLNGDEIQLTARCSVNQLRKSLIGAARKTVKIIEAKMWDTEETRKLRRLLNSLN
ncbi:MAG: hypothetical protein VR69_10875 [Peptococcaceae bacterium BRH_c4b]|nr:MAG: hypothetical protein VR69_10875 [Peptococcaceae bacterium BRH_c4b]